MIPNVFVSSTIQDLHHLRDGIRDALVDIGYVPVMSEYGDIGYLPSASAEESCYIAMRQCHLAVLIVGRRYGEPKSDGLSVTHREFYAARDAGIPVITLVERDVMAFKAVRDVNPNTANTFPGMDHPDRVFALIQDIAIYPVNNGFLTFSTVADARSHVKRQIAHLVGDLLQKRGGGIAPDVKDILAEIKTLRHELTTRGGDSARPFLRVMRLLVDDKNSVLATLIKRIHGELDEAVPSILQQPTFDSFIQASGWTLQVQDPLRKEAFEKAADVPVTYLARFIADYIDEAPVIGEWLAAKNKVLVMNTPAKFYFERQYETLRAAR